MSSKTKVRHTKYFKGELKRLFKKFPSIVSDVEQLGEILLKQPHTGAPLGNNAYKIRLAVKSKGKGKSGGARVISHVETEIIARVENTTVTLLTIYDKSKTDSISQEEIAALIKNMKFE